MEAYFDNSATTKVTDSVKDIVIKTMVEDYGNPSSMHMVGVEAEKYIKTAKENIAKILKVDEKEIYFSILFSLSKVFLLPFSLPKSRTPSLLL